LIVVNAIGRNQEGRQRREHFVEALHHPEIVEHGLRFLRSRLKLIYAIINRIFILLSTKPIEQVVEKSFTEMFNALQEILTKYFADNLDWSIVGINVLLDSPEHLAMAGRNLWLLGIWLEHVLKNIPFHDRYNEFTDELTNAHVPELCLER
jgi:hypothetical protein